MDYFIDFDDPDELQGYEKNEKGDIKVLGNDQSGKEFKFFFFIPFNID